MRKDGFHRWLTLAGGLASVASGAAMIFAPEPLAALWGLPTTRAQTRWLGARDVTIGLGLLGSVRRAAWWALRGAGDAMDTSMLVGASRSRTGWLAKARIAGGLGLTALSTWMAITDWRSRGWAFRRLEAHAPRR
jgi:hypothetical protein